MASRKTAHRRRRVHSSKRRKNVKSRKVMRGGDQATDIRRCNVKGGILAPQSPAKEYIINVARSANIIPDGVMCSKLVKGNYKWEKTYVSPPPSTPPRHSKASL